LTLPDKEQPGAGNYDALLFDFDGVLADTEPLHCAAWAEVLAPLGLDLTWDFYRRHGIGVTDRVLLEAVLTDAGSTLTADVLLEHWPAKQEAFRRRVLASPPLEPSVIDFIKALREFRLAVVTSSQVWEIEPALVAAGIRPLFQVLVGAADVLRHKPAPDPYLEAAARLGARCPLVIEDSDAGVASGRAAGFDVVRVADAAEMPAQVSRALGR
jgi:beta-phosphoglucomutase